ncbi:MAG TPA: hypothetical protein VMD27_08560 [Candidatus Aquilonibacter sp.]|nr:hypothetical protein [Candidatus Aquilonibacter sp.]
MKRFVQIFSAALVLAALMTTKVAAQNLNEDTPVDFFTNVASRLLASQLNVNLTRIEIYPTNQFTPAVHRLLQVAANLYDASTNRYYDEAAPPMAMPTVFQPVFSVENGCVYITNFVEVTDTSFLTNTLRDLNGGPAVVAALQPNDLVFGVPLIIGVKKGFPNFNEFAMQTAFQLMRKIQVTRASTNAAIAPISSYTINQMFGLSLSNQLAVECWNSYSSNYTRPISIYANDYLTVTLTNDEGFSTTAPMIVSGSIQIPNPTTNVWPAFNLISPAASFQIPLNTNVTPVPNSIYRFNGGNPYLTTDITVPFETGVNINGSPYPQPHWGWEITNDLQVFMVDVNSGRIIDYVQLSGPNNNLDLTAAIQQEWDFGTQTGYNDLWDTNLDPNYLNMPYGIINQLGVSLGEFGLGNGSWQMSQTEIETEIDAFRVFYHFPPIYFPANNYGAAAAALAMQVPYTATATIFQNTSWQANDPLVHYLASDLNTRFGNSIFTVSQWPGNIGYVNQRYMPWGGNPLLPGADQNPYNVALKDPLVYSSDYWNFPDGQPLNPGWIGQVHRGTPWQTIYLKSSDILAGGGLATWTNWTGDADATDAAAMAPVQDWHLASLLTTLLNTNNFASLFPVNNPNPNAWQGLLNGLIASTNIPDPSDSVLISSNSAQASAIASAIQSERMAQPGQFFRDIGDILATSQLAEQSPFLAGVNSNSISDADYELISSQLLSLLRADSVGSVALMNGQPLVQFTGYDGHTYAIQASSDLINWVSIGTNCPVDGLFSFTNSMNLNPQFFRSVLLQ